jgi:hypothetical protein
MGCLVSKQAHTLTHVDDSVHVMLSHEKKVAKKKGLPAATEYVPRAEHPLFLHRSQDNNTTTTTDINPTDINNNNTTQPEESTVTTPPRTRPAIVAAEEEDS